MRTPIAYDYAALAVRLKQLEGKSFDAPTITGPAGSAAARAAAPTNVSPYDSNIFWFLDVWLDGQSARHVLPIGAGIIYACEAAGQIHYLDSRQSRHVVTGRVKIIWKPDAPWMAAP